MRFDDLAGNSPSSFAFRGLQRHIIARRIEDVIPALEETERAVADGYWAGGFVAYEAAPAFDRALTARPRTAADSLAHLPLVWFGIFERVEKYRPFDPRTIHPAPYHVSSWSPGVDPEEYAKAIARIHDRISAGDTYQVNLTFPMKAAFSGDAYEFYRDMVTAQRGQFSAYLDAGRYRVLSASPEMFFRLGKDTLETKPMKGTIRRGRWPAEDLLLAHRLEGSEKDQAENLMIVDLLRNDLGKISEFGSVKTNHLLNLERFETVWQLTSEITSKPRKDLTVTDVFRALFPSGSITGAPKPATTKIISELEATPRGVYCGAIGYLTPEGSGFPRACFSVAIRTAVLDQEEGVVEYGVGGGITWDSRSATEYDEALLKAQLLTDRRPDFDLIETIRYAPDEGFWLLDEHLSRMTASAGYFGFSIDPGRTREVIEAEAADADGPVMIRVQVDRAGDTWASSAPLDPEGFSPDGPHEGAKPIQVVVDDEGVRSDNVFLFHKTTMRNDYDRARKAHSSFDDVILVNERREVTESIIGNVFVKFHGEWWTPPLDCGLLDGVHRRWLLDRGIAKERVIAASELIAAEEVAIVNSVRGWREAHVIEHDVAYTMQ